MTQFAAQFSTTARLMAAMKSSTSSVHVITMKAKPVLSWAPDFLRRDVSGRPEMGKIGEKLHMLMVVE